MLIVFFAFVCFPLTIPLNSVQNLSDYQWLWFAYPTSFIHHAHNLLGKPWVWDICWLLEPQIVVTLFYLGSPGQETAVGYCWNLKSKSELDLLKCGCHLSCGIRKMRWFDYSKEVLEMKQLPSPPGNRIYLEIIATIWFYIMHQRTSITVRIGMFLFLDGMTNISILLFIQISIELQIQDRHQPHSSHLHSQNVKMLTISKRHRSTRK
jgi:hypothetical protein